MATESYPDDLRYHPEHDWARIDGDEAVLGITWYAQDSLGELVLFDGPEVGATIANGLNIGGYSTGTIYVVTGVILLLAVTLDTVARRLQVRAGR